MYSLARFIAIFVQVFANIMSVLVIIRVLLSWLIASGKHPGNIGRLVYDITEPLMNMARKLPHRIGMMDFSPIIALIGIDLCEYLILLLLKSL